MTSYSKQVDEAVAKMHLHDCDGRIEPYDKNMVFGWMCSCGKGWLFRLWKFKMSGMGSKWREEISTLEGRTELIHMVRGAMVVRGEMSEVG